METFVVLPSRKLVVDESRINDLRGKVKGSLKRLGSCEPKTRSGKLTWELREKLDQALQGLERCEVEG